MYKLSRSVIKHPLKVVLYRRCTSICVEHHCLQKGENTECARSGTSLSQQKPSDGIRCMLNHDEVSVHLMYWSVSNNQSLRPCPFHNIETKKTDAVCKHLISAEKLQTLPVLYTGKQFHAMSGEQILWKCGQELKKKSLKASRIGLTSVTDTHCQSVSETGQEEIEATGDRYSKGMFTGKQLDSIFGLEEKDTKRTSDTLHLMTDILQAYLNTASRNLSEFVTRGSIGQSGHCNKSLQSTSTQYCDNDAAHLVSMETHLSGSPSDIFRGDWNTVKTGVHRESSVPDPLGQHVVYCTASDAPHQQSSGQNKSESQLPNADQLSLLQDHLVTELPKMLTKTTKYNVYTGDIVLENNVAKRPYITKPGINRYALQILKFKLYTAGKYVNCGLTILKSTTHTEDGTIRIRWQFRGLPQMKILSFWTFFPGRNAKHNESEYIDGISTFSINKQGLIYRHRMDKVIPDDHKVLEAKSTFADSLRKVVTGAAT